MYSSAYSEGDDFEYTLYYGYRALLPHLAMLLAMIRKGTILSSPVTSFMVDVRVGPFNIDD